MPLPWSVLLSLLHLAMAISMVQISLDAVVHHLLLINENKASAVTQAVFINMTVASVISEMQISCILPQLNRLLLVS